MVLRPVSSFSSPIRPASAGDDAKIGSMSDTM